MLYKLCTLVGTVMLLNAAFSVMQYRKHLQNTESDESVSLPLDIKAEIVIGLLLAITSIVLNETMVLKRIRLNAVNAESTKSYEKGMNQNRSAALRNIQRSRGGAVFSSGVSNVYPKVKDVLDANKRLKDIILT